MTEVKLRVVRLTEGQAQELRQLLDSPNLSRWDQGRMRALAQLAPQREHEEALVKLERMRVKREAKAKAAAKKGGAKQGDDDGFVSIVNSWR